MAMTIYTYKRKFSLAQGGRYDVHVASGVSTLTLRLFQNGVELGADSLNVHVDGSRHLFVRIEGAEGKLLEVESAPVDWLTMGIIARLDGAVVFESHPGRTLAWPAALTVKVGGDPAQRKALAQENASRFKKNVPSLLTDIALAVAFYFVGKEYGIVTAAVTGALAGVVLWVVQKITKIDLLGGLAVFGIIVSLISAAYALAVNDPWLVQMRSTIFGLAIAALFFGDGLFLKGRRLGARIERYMPPGTAPERLSIGIGALGIVISSMNWAVAALLPEDVWLFYTSFLDTPLAMILGVAVVIYARPRAKV